jgi:type II secretory pathway component PulJ
MSNLALVAIVVGALVTVLTIAALGAIVTQRVSRALDDATTAAARLTAASAAIGEHQGVTRRELDRLHTSLEGLRDSRGRR